MIKLQGKDDFSGTITLFTTDLPDGMKASFEPKEVSLTSDEPLNVSQLSIFLQADVEGKKHPLTILATSSNGNTKQISLTAEVIAKTLDITTISLLVKPKEIKLGETLDIQGQLIVISDKEVDETTGCSWS